MQRVLYVADSGPPLCDVSVTDLPVYVYTEQLFLRYYSLTNFSAPFFATSISKFDFQYSSSSPIPSSSSGLQFSVVFDSIFAVPLSSGMHEIYSVVSNPHIECVFLQLGSYIISSNLNRCFDSAGFSDPPGPTSQVSVQSHTLWRSL